MPEIHQPVDQATWTELLAAGAKLAELAPWRFASDCDIFGIRDRTTKEVRLGHVLGNGGEVFAAVIYRNGGIAWLLSVLDSDSETVPDDAAEGMDCLKLEWVPKREMEKEDLAILAASGFKPKGRGPVWPQFRSSQPGWHPWHLDLQEARQLLADLAQLTAFLRLFEKHPDLFANRSHLDIPFLCSPVPARGLTLEDIEWLPLVLPPEPELHGAKIPDSELQKLNALKRAPRLAFEFDVRLALGASVMVEGRTCLTRLALLVDASNGIVAGCELQSAADPAAQATGLCLATTLLKAGFLPGALILKDLKRQAAVAPLCTQLGIRTTVAKTLPFLEEAFESLSQALLTRRGGGVQ